MNTKESGTTVAARETRGWDRWYTDVYDAANLDVPEAAKFSHLIARYI